MDRYGGTPLERGADAAPVRRRATRARVRPVLVAVAAMGAVALAGCATSAPAGAPGASSSGASSPGGGKVRVVAAENFWGSIATQLGGDHAAVTSIITNPDADPHDYEPTPADGRAIATAQYVMVNNIGYDPWAQKLIDANPSPSRTELSVQAVAGLPDDGNPHQWYSQPVVEKVANQMTADFKKIDPGNAGYFDGQRQAFETQALGRYHQLINDIRTRYAGTPIGASESIVAPLAQSTDLNLITPPSLLEAVSEGNDPTAADKATTDAQIKNRQIKLYVYNSQNATPDVQGELAEAQAARIPVATVTETLVPATASFQDWQAGQLQAIEAALAAGAGR